MKTDTLELVNKLYEFDEETIARVLEEVKHYFEVQGYANEMRENPTQSERDLKNLLIASNINNDYQKVIETINNHYYIADFEVKNNLIIEVDGGYHQLDEQIEKDKKRTSNLEKAGYDTIRITNEEIEAYYKVCNLIVFLQLNNKPVSQYNDKDKDKWIRGYNFFTERGIKKNCGEKVLNELQESDLDSLKEWEQLENTVIN